jgi:hypothetical protein
MTSPDLVRRHPTLEPWSGGERMPWSDEYFSIRCWERTCHGLTIGLAAGRTPSIGTSLGSILMCCRTADEDP